MAGRTWGQGDVGRPIFAAGESRVQTSLRKFWLSLNASYWFIPTLLTLTALVLSFATIYIDRNGGAQWLTDLAWVQVTRPDGARSLLTVISSSMIGVASPVFAITTADVVYASRSEERPAGKK